MATTNIDEAKKASYDTVRVLMSTLLRYGYPNSKRAEEAARNIAQALIDGPKDKDEVREIVKSVLHNPTRLKWYVPTSGCLTDLVDTLVDGKFVVLTNNTKYLADWQSLTANPKALGLSEFLQVGDYVDQEFYEYLRDAVPPFTGLEFLQMGEPYATNDEGRFTFVTIQRHGQRWVYTGLRTNYDYVRIIS